MLKKGHLKKNKSQKSTSEKAELAAPPGLDALFAEQPSKKAKYKTPVKEGPSPETPGETATPPKATRKRRKTKDPDTPTQPTTPKATPKPKPLDAMGMYSIFKKVVADVATTLVDGKVSEGSNPKTLLLKFKAHLGIDFKEIQALGRDGLEWALRQMEAVS